MYMTLCTSFLIALNEDPHYHPYIKIYSSADSSWAFSSCLCMRHKGISPSVRPHMGALNIFFFFAAAVANSIIEKRGEKATLAPNKTNCRNTWSKNNFSVLEDRLLCPAYISLWRFWCGFVWWLYEYESCLLSLFFKKTSKSSFFSWTTLNSCRKNPNSSLLSGIRKTSGVRNLLFLPWKWEQCVTTRRIWGFGGGACLFSRIQDHK